MKKLIIFLLSAFASLSLSAQNNPMLTPLPNDPAVKIGKLDNGLTYYIRKNSLPEKRAEFYLLTKAGGIFETPDQDGLAHFLEHMCFNGTERFPGKGILNYLQSIGAEFGRNINASTGFEETQYMLNNIPVERASVADSCLLILSEYANYVLNEEEELDLERPVIIEERRSRRNADWRTMEACLPYWFGDTKYATCTLIGQEENLKTFKKSSIDNFYATWYYPERQAVIVVGDINPSAIEASIKKHFGRIPKNENPSADPDIPFPGNAEPSVGVITDPELEAPSVSVMWKSEADPEEHNAGMLGKMNTLVKSIIARIMDERFTDITSKPGAPYINGSFYVGKLIYERIDVAEASVILNEENILGGFRDFYTEIERMRRYGFTDAEYGRAKTNIESRNEAAVQKASTRKNAEFIRPISNHFFDHWPILEPKTEQQLDAAILGQLKAEIINQILPQLLTDENIVLLYTGPQKEGIATPSKEELLKVVEEVKASDIKPLEGEEIASELLDASKLKAGKVKKSESSVYGATKWTLSNGIEVYLLPTEHRKNQILFNLYREGGSSLVATEDLPSMESTIISLFQQNSGLAGFPRTEYSKMLTGKNLSVGPYINNLTNGISGNSTKKDLETAFQLIYLNYTQPRFDPEEYQVGLDQLKSMLPGLMNTPSYKLQVKLVDVLYGGNPRVPVISFDIIDKASVNTLKNIHSQLFSGTKGLKMLIVGDFTPEEIQPLVEKYIGGIKKGGKALAWKDDGTDVVDGIVKCNDPVKMETPTTTAVLYYHAPMEYNELNHAALDAISYILDLRNTATLREEIGGTYGASSRTKLSDLPKAEATLQIAFQCKPELTETLVTTAQEIVENLAMEGPTEEEVSKAVLNLQKNVPENRLSNSYWLNLIKDYLMNPVEIDKAYEQAVNKLTAADIQAAAVKLLEAGNMIEFIQSPAE